MQEGNHQGLGTVDRVEGWQYILGVPRGHKGILSSPSRRVCPCHSYIYGACIRMVGPVCAQEEKSDTG